MVLCAPFSYTILLFKFVEVSIGRFQDEATMESPRKFGSGLEQTNASQP